MKISVIIPVYNVESWLRECLDSVITQTLEDIEIICINDGSPDNSLEILEEYAEKDSRIIVVNQENMGVAKTRNKGINMAQGEYVIFMDPDDFYPSIGTLELLYTKAKENNALICGGNICYDSDYYLYPNSFTTNLNNFLVEGFVGYRDYKKLFYFQPYIYNREFLTNNNIYFPNYTHTEDFVFLLKAIIKAEGFYAVDKITYVYRQGHKEWNYSKRNILDHLSAVKDLIYMVASYDLNDLHKSIIEIQIFYNLKIMSKNIKPQYVLSRLIEIFFTSKYARKLFFKLLFEKFKSVIKNI